MASGDADQVIAERRLNLVAEDGQIREALVRLGAPKRVSDDEYSCTFQIVGLGDDKPRPIYGSDAFHALELTLKLISFLLKHYRDQANGQLYWLEPGDDMGFGYIEPGSL